MEQIRLGQTGLQVSRICLGTMTYGSPKWRDWVLPEAFVGLTPAPHRNVRHRRLGRRARPGLFALNEGARLLGARPLGKALTDLALQDIRRAHAAAGVEVPLIQVFLPGRGVFRMR